MKRLWIGIVLAALAVAVVLSVMEGNGDPAERITRECQRSFGWQGEQAVMDCKVQMMVRAGSDIAKRQADDTYNRIR